MVYQVAEKFRSIQGEGVFAGTPMAFIRFVGCSVGKRICQHCDTDFDKAYPWRGGGEFAAAQLLSWANEYDHICLTGGEPLDQDLGPLLALGGTPHDTVPLTFHIETSGTKDIRGQFGVATIPRVWICVSPKPGFIEEVVMQADEVKVIVPGLGEMNDGLYNNRLIQMHPKEEHSRTDEDWTNVRRDFRWPTLQDALRWADAGKIVFIQPRNAKHDIDYVNLRLCQDIVAEHPQLRLSVQLHKVLRVQ